MGWAELNHHWRMKDDPGVVIDSDGKTYYWIERKEEGDRIHIRLMKQWVTFSARVKQERSFRDANKADRCAEKWLNELRKKHEGWTKDERLADSVPESGPSKSGEEL